MTRFVHNPEFHGAIAEVSAWNRPLWSVVIPTYNCASYLREALHSVLAQDPGRDQMEIIVVDDHSTKDDPESVVREIAGERVHFLRQSANVGKARNYETGIATSTGHVIHQLHGDDRVGDGFYASMQKCLEDFPEVGAVFCETKYINADGEVVGRTGRELETSGVLEDWLPKIVCCQRIQTPSVVVRRAVYERLGGFDRRLPYAEDWEMWIRIASHYSFAFNAEAIAQYRIYPQNTSSQSVVSGKRTSVLRKMISIVDDYLPPELLRQCASSRSKELAFYLARCMPATVKHRSFAAWFRLVVAALGFHFSPRLVYHMFLFTVRYRKYV